VIISPFSNIWRSFQQLCDRFGNFVNPFRGRCESLYPRCLKVTPSLIDSGLWYSLIYVFGCAFEQCYFETPFLYGKDNKDQLVGVPTWPGTRLWFGITWIWLTNRDWGLNFKSFIELPLYDDNKRFQGALSLWFVRHAKFSQFHLWLVYQLEMAHE